MEEHRNKTLIMLAVVVVLAAIVGVVYYFSSESNKPQTTEGNPLSPEDIRRLDAQTDVTKLPNPGALNQEQIRKLDTRPIQKNSGALTSEQIKALDAR